MVAFVPWWRTTARSPASVAPDGRGWGARVVRVLVHCGPVVMTTETESFEQ